jgi:hypothetical protein
MSRVLWVGLLLGIFQVGILLRTNGQTPVVDSRPQEVHAEGLHNVFRISGNLYSGNGPESDVSFLSLQKLGVKTAISVDGAPPDLERAKKVGIRYVHIPIGYDGVHQDKAFQIAKAIHDLPGPFYIHCHHGKHRGPAAAAVAMLCADPNCQIKDALAVMQQAGTDPRYKGLFQSVQNLKRPSSQEIAKSTASLPEVVKPAGTQQAMIAIDHTSDRLKSSQAAGWKQSPDHPDVEPAHEALQLVEAFMELRRLPAIEQRPEAFRTLLDEGLAGAQDLERILRAAKTTPVKEAADTAYRRVNVNCTQCHTTYRDV